MPEMLFLTDGDTETVVWWSVRRLTNEVRGTSSVKIGVSRQINKPLMNQ